MTRMIPRPGSPSVQRHMSSKRPPVRTGTETAAGHVGGLAVGALALMWIVFVSAACVSNPTPHPANDAGVNQDTGRGDGDPNIAAPSDEAGCDAVGGFWTGDDCYTEAASPDSDAPSLLADASDAFGDGGPEDGDADDPDAGPDAGTGGDSEDGKDGAGASTPR